MRILRFSTILLILCSSVTSCESSGSVEKPIATEPTLIPQVSLEAVHVDFDIITDSLVIGRVQTKLHNESEVSRRLYLQYSITDRNGGVQQYSTQEQALEAGEELSKTKIIDLHHPVIWSPEDPQLYQLTVTAFADDIVVDQQEFQTSIRPGGNSDTALNQHPDQSCMPTRNAFVR